jgi:hypothetical protein
LNVWQIEATTMLGLLAVAEKQQNNMQKQLDEMRQ